MAARWHTVRVFISSTFRDMHAERDYLVRFVFPKLRDTLSRRRINLVDVDLRWGVTSDQDALEVCREIIDECRPRFLCLLGGRYGWTPPGRSRSITEDEVRYAVLDRIDDDALAFFYFRDPAATAQIIEPRPGEYREPPQSSEAARLETLKRSIRERGLEVFVYPALWDRDAQRLVGLEALGDRVYADILQSIDAEFGVDAPVASDATTLEHEAQEAHAEELLEHFVPGQRQGLLDHLVAFAKSEGQPQVLVLTGPAGSGKSTLFAACRRRLAEDEALSDAALISHAAGASSGSSTLNQTLVRLCRDLDRFTSPASSLPDDEGGLVNAFADRLTQVGRTRRVVLLLDGIDELMPSEFQRTMTWLPRTLPPGVRLLVTCTDEDLAATLRRRYDVLSEPMPRFPYENAVALATRFLGRYGKRLSDSQLQELLAKDEARALPLYVVTVLDELRTLGRYEEISDRIRLLPARTGDLFRWILQRLSDDSSLHDSGGVKREEELVRSATSLLAISRQGLTAADLMTLVAPGDPRGHLSALLRLLRPYLTTRGELIDFRHGLFRDAVRASYVTSAEEAAVIHRRLGEHFLSAADSAGDLTWTGQHVCALAELPHHMSRGRSWDALYRLLTDFEYLRRRVAFEWGEERDYGTLHVVPRFDRTIALGCESCGWSATMDTATMAQARRAVIRCGRCGRLLRIAQLVGVDPIDSLHACAVTCQRCTAITEIPKEWFHGGVRFAHVICKTCGEETVADVRPRQTRRYTGGVGLQEDFRSALGLWPVDGWPPEWRLVLERVQQSMRLTASAYQAAPELLFPQLFPHLSASVGAATRECRAIVERYAQRLSRRESWLRVSWGVTAPSFEALAFAAPGAMTSMCMIDPAGPLIAATADGRVVMVDLATGKIDVIPCEARSILVVNQARSDRHPGVLIVAQGGQVFILDIDSRELRPAGSGGAAHAAAIAVDGRLVATGSHWGEIVVWDALTREARASVMVRRSAIVRLCFSGSGESLVVRYVSGVVGVHDVASLTQVAPSNTRGCFLPAAAEDAWWFVGEEGKLFRFTRTGRAEVAGRTVKARVTAGSVSAQGRLAAMGTADGRVIAFADDGVPAREFATPGGVTAVLHSATLGVVAAGDDRGNLRVWHLRPTAGDADVVVQMASAPAFTDGVVAVGSSGGDCVLFASDGTERGRLPGPFPFSGPMAGAQSAPIVVAGAEHGWQAWDTAAQAVRGFARLSGGLTSLAVSPHGDIVCTGSAAGVIALWDRATGAERGRREVGRAEVAGLASGPDGELVFSIAGDGCAAAWRMVPLDHDDRRGRRLFVAGEDEAESGYLAAIALEPVWKVQLDVSPASIDVSPDGSHIVVGAEDHVVILATGDGHRVGVLETPLQTWRSVAFAAYDRLLLGVAARGAVNVWNLGESWRLLCHYELLAEPVGAVWLTRVARFCVSDSEGRLLWMDVAGLDRRVSGHGTAPPVRRLRRFIDQSRG